MGQIEFVPRYPHAAINQKGGPNSFGPSVNVIVQFIGQRSIVSSKSMLKALIGLCTLHLTTIFLLLWATIDDAWWFTRTMYTDLWGRWVNERNDDVWIYMDIPTSYRKDYLQAVQAFVVLSCLFAIISLCVFLFQLFTLGKGKRFTYSGVLQLLSCFCIMVALSVYTDHFHRDEEGWYGWSYIMAWLSWLLTLINGTIYIILRKRVD